MAREVRTLSQYDFPADIFNLATTDAIWHVQQTAYITMIRWNVTIYNGRPWWKDWWNFKNYQVPVYEYILSYWVNLEWLAIWSHWQIHIMAHQAVKSASKPTNCEHFEYQMWLTNSNSLHQLLDISRSLHYVKLLMSQMSSYFLLMLLMNLQIKSQFISSMCLLFSSLSTV